MGLSKGPRRKRSRDLEQRYRQLIEDINDGYILVDMQEGKAIFANTRCAELFGYRPEEMIGQLIDKFLTPESMKEIAELWQGVLSGAAAPERLEAKGLNKEGIEIPVEFSIKLAPHEGEHTYAVLVRDITERKRAEETLKQSEEKYRYLIEGINDGYVVLRRDRIIFANKRSAEMMGTPLEEIIGESFFKLVAPESLETLEQIYEASMRGETPKEKVELSLYKPDGTKTYIELVFRDIIYEGKPAVSAIIRDITERKQAEEEILKHTKQLEALYSVASVASQTLDLGELLDRALYKVQEVMELDAGLIYLFIPKAEEVVLKAHRGISEELAREIAGIKLQHQEIERAIQSEEPTVSAESIFNEAGAALFMGLQEREGFRSYTAVPLWAKGVLHGVMAIASYSEREFTPEDIGLLQALGNQIAVAIENASLYRDIKDKAERLAVTAKLTRIIVSSLDIEEVFDTFASEVKRLVDFDRASIAVVEGDRLRFIAVSSAMETELAIGTTVPLQESATAWVVENKTHNIETDFAQEARFSIDETLFKEGLRSAIRLPLFSKGEVFGTFNLMSRHPNAYGERELEILEELAGQIATAIQNDRLYQESEQRKDELEGAYDQLMSSARALDRGKRDLEDAYLSMARTLVLTLEARDPYTRGHSERVAQFSRQTAIEMGLSREEMRTLETAARLHDLGKIGIPDAILLKAGPITPSERAEIQLHPTRAVELLRFLGFMDGVLPIVEGHHERYNGGGYPDGIKGELTPLGARILAVADAYDAMTSTRPYRPPMTSDEVIGVLRKGAGTQWDPKVVEAFLRTFGK
ncbi:MAG: PAS domain S-box protein [Dehalococcoidia bacterium]|nr:PAS domain S-box protein [Dehalococcoidia bacterium]